ncbi:MAG: SPFH domain-containing protein, partial [Brachybacterium sp.]
LLMTQYFDTMQDVARNARSNVLYLPSNPGAVGTMGDEIRTAMLQSQAAAAASQDADVADADSRKRISAEQLREQEQQRAERARAQAEQRAREARQQAQQAQPPRQAPNGYPGGSVPPWTHPGSANQG